MLRYHPEPEAGPDPCARRPDEDAVCPARRSRGGEGRRYRSRRRRGNSGSDVHIATVAEGGSLNMEMRVNRGRGYVSADKNFVDDLGIGWISARFGHSPVKKVNYVVEAARLGQTTDYDKLTVDVWTDGSVTARDAVSLGAQLIRDHLNIFINIDDPWSRRRIRSRPPRCRCRTSTSTAASRNSSYRCDRTTAEECRNNDHSGAGVEDRIGDAAHQELWPQVADRDQGTACQHGSEPWHASGGALGPRIPCRRYR